MTNSEATGSVHRNEESEPVLPAEGVSRVGKYRLFASIGKGGMAEVFLAVARGPMGFNKLVVVKRMRERLTDHEPGAAQMFIDEAKLAARLSHPNIVQTYEIGDHEGTLFIAMEYLEGQPLRHFIERHKTRGVRVPLPMALRIVADALSGLHCAHELADYDGRSLGVVHRDVSPHNVFLTYDGVTKILDFGIAKASLNSEKTATGVLKGKLGYFSPEQALGGAMDRRSDVFAVGVMLWELIADQRLYPGDAVQSLHKLMSGDAPRLSKLVPEVDPGLEAVVTKALCRDAAGRFASADEFRREVEACGARVGIAHASEVGRALVSEFQRKREALRRRIEVEMNRVTNSVAPLPISTSGSHPKLDMGSTGSNPQASPILSLTGEFEAAPSSGSASALIASSMAAPKSKLPMALVAGAVLLAVVGAGVVALRGRDTRATVASTPLVTPLVTPPATTTVATATQAAAATLTTVMLASNPAGAAVQWNGRSLGLTPATFELPPGAQTLMLSKDGFMPLPVYITVPAAGGEPLRHSVSLDAKQNDDNRRQSSASAGVARGGRSVQPAAQPAAAPQATAAPQVAAAPQAPTAAAPVARPTVQVIEDKKPGVRVLE